MRAFRAGLLTACAIGAFIAHASPQPPFDQSREQISLVLDVVEWLGSVEDLGDVPVVVGGLGIRPNPHEDAVRRRERPILNHTTILDQAPLSPGSNISIHYQVTDPKELIGRHDADPQAYPRPGLAFAGSVWLNLTASDLCVRMEDAIARLGEPRLTRLVESGWGGPINPATHGWFGKASATRRTAIWVRRFRDPANTCIASFGIVQ